MIEIPKLKCNQCGHEWIPRTQDVRVCPNRRCHSLRWDKPNTDEEDLRKLIDKARKDLAR